jgi:hypothetical protein
MNAEFRTETSRHSSPVELTVERLDPENLTPSKVVRSVSRSVAVVAENSTRCQVSSTPSTSSRTESASVTPRQSAATSRASVTVLSAAYVRSKVESGTSTPRNSVSSLRNGVTR